MISCVADLPDADKENALAIAARCEKPPSKKPREQGQRAILAVAGRASFSTDEEAWKAYGSSRQRFYEWKPMVEALLAAEAAANPSTQPMEDEEPGEDDPAQQAEAAARLRQLHAQAQARYRERLRLPQAVRQRLCGWPRSRRNSRLLRLPTKRPAVRRGGCSRLGESAGSCNGTSCRIRDA